jgi:hypothetical protein
MKTLAAIVCLLSFGPGGVPEPGIAYFARVREVAIAAPDRQSYVVLDPSIWANAREDLADLRLYDRSSQVPYRLVAQVAASSSEEVEARLFNLARRGDDTEFDLDVSPVTDYNRIRLVLDRKDFLVTARVEGRDVLVGGPRVVWPSPSTLFDFSRENLGSNSTINLPTWSFRYVHVHLSPGILPSQVQRATVAHLEEKRARWTGAGSCLPTGQQQQPRSTVIHCDLPPRMPLDHIRFDVPASEINFRRIVKVADDQGQHLAEGTISRIRMKRGGTVAQTEDLMVSVWGARHARLVITIENGDDPPLKLEAIQPEALERRMYFDPKGAPALKLYYGDDKLAAPVYDYARFFHEEPGAVRAQLGPDLQNSAYTGRPDDRPWSERHDWILWAAMLLAVAALAILAVRGLRSEAKTSS